MVASTDERELHKRDAAVLGAPDISRLRSGNAGVEGVWTFDSGRAGRHVMITALVHGNELCGAWALKGLLEAGFRPSQGRVTLAFCNLAAFDRFDPSNHDASRFVDEDLNRQWSDDRLAAGGTVERRRARELAPFVQSADWLLDLHSMHERSAPLCLTGLSWQNVQLGLRMKTPAHIVIDAGHKDGVRMRDYGPFAASAVDHTSNRSLLVECGFHTEPESRLVAQDQCARILQLAGVTDAYEPFLNAWKMPDAASQTILKVTGGVVASTSGFRFSAPYTGLETIKAAGTVIGWDDGFEVTTPYDDCVLVMPSIRQARAGVTVVRFARSVVARA
jgi:predicted deacylase